MNHFIAIIVAGLLGTTCMTSVMSIIHRSGFANADMVRAIGSMVTRTYENSLMPGLLIHFTSGIIFAFIYSTGMGILLPVESIIAAAILGVFMGIFHGIVVSMVLVMAVSDSHPLE